MKNFFNLIVMLYSTICFAQTTYYVSSNGDDSYNGTTEQTPWKTLSKVNQKLASLNAGDQVLFRSGDTFYGTLEIKQLDGAEGNEIKFSSYGTGAHPPVLSATQALNNSDWQEHGQNIWKLEDSNLGDEVRKLSIDGAWKPVGRWPDRVIGNESSGWREYTNVSGKKTFSDLDGLGVDDNHWNGAEVIIGIAENGYMIERLTVISQNNNKFNTSDASSDIYTGEDHYYYLQNHEHCLSLPGEWAYYANTETLYLYSDEQPNQTIRVTNTDNALLVENSTNIEFSKLVIEGGNQCVVENKNSENITYDNVEVRQGAFDGVGFIGGCDDVTFKNGRIHEIGNNGLHINVNGSGNVTISDNILTNIGLDRGAGGEGGAQSVGIRIESGNDITISYNEIYRIGYHGITLEDHYTTKNPTTTQNCTIQYNYIHSYCLTKQDGGGIYTWQRTSERNHGHVLDHNIVVADVQSRDKPGMMEPNDLEIHGIYCDDRSHDIDVSNNTCVGGKHSLYLHSASDITVTNNNLYGGKFSLLALVDDKDNVDMLNIRATNNKMIYSPTTPRALYLKDVRDEYSHSNEPISFNGDYIIDPFHSEFKVALLKDLSENTRTWDWDDWIGQDWVEDYEAPVLNYDSNIPTGYFVFYTHNPTKEVKTVTLSGKYKDVDGSLVSGDIEVPPYESRILFMDNEINVTNGATITSTYENEKLFDGDKSTFVKYFSSCEPPIKDTETITLDFSNNPVDVSSVKFDLGSSFGDHIVMLRVNEGTYYTCFESLEGSGGTITTEVNQSGVTKIEILISIALGTCESDYYLNIHEISVLRKTGCNGYVMQEEAFAYYPLNYNSYSYGSERGICGDKPFSENYTDDGRLGGALMLYGGNYVNIQNPDKFNELENSFTITAWINPSSVSSRDNTIFSKVNPGRDFVFKLRYDKLDFHIENGGYAFYPVSNYTISTDQWTHVAVVFNSGHVKQFINGVKVYDKEKNKLPRWSGSKVQIGAMNGGELFKGKIDDLRVYSNALTVDDIRDIYGGLKSAKEIELAEAPLPKQINVYPNPVGNRLFVELPASESNLVHYQIFDLAGKMVMGNTVSVNGRLMEVPVEMLETGSYLVQVSVNNRKHTKLFLKE